LPLIENVSGLGDILESTMSPFHDAGMITHYSCNYYSGRLDSQCLQCPVFDVDDTIRKKNIPRNIIKRLPTYIERQMWQEQRPKPMQQWR